QELEELRGLENRVGNRRVLDQLLLCKLRAQVAASQQTLGTDDRQRHMVGDAGGGLTAEEVMRRRLEELHHCSVFERGRVRDVDNHGGTAQGFGQTLTGDSVDSRAA